MSVITTDGAAIVTSGGGFVSFATDRSMYLYGGIDPATQVTFPSPQVVKWCAPGSTWPAIFVSLCNPGFTVKQIGGNAEFLAQSFVFNSSGPLSALPNVALSFFEARG